MCDLVDVVRSLLYLERIRREGAVLCERRVLHGEGGEAVELEVLGHRPTLPQHRHLSRNLHNTI